MLYQLSHVRVCAGLTTRHRYRSTTRWVVEPNRSRADDGIRTRDPHLGKVMLYQLSHVRAASAVDPRDLPRSSPSLR